MESPGRRIQCKGIREKDEVFQLSGFGCDRPCQCTKFRRSLFARQDMHRSGTCRFFLSSTSRLLRPALQSCASQFPLRRALCYSTACLELPLLAPKRNETWVEFLKNNREKYHVACMSSSADVDLRSVGVPAAMNSVWWKWAAICCRHPSDCREIFFSSKPCEREVLSDAWIHQENNLRLGLLCTRTS